ncbi:N-acetylmuramoyl-L-alanine amidase family protein [Oceanobacillus sp. CF4.6]|uniref:N-acetylmuramoyl-L-alanine amidase family protein n=1 Tax=Oceanobacillus sp. CF4.6 TaxID=3373080 RepID=UPI003EE656B3
MAYPFNGYTVGLDYGHGNKTFPPSKGVYKVGKAYHEHNFNSRLGLAIKELLIYNGFKIVEGQKPYSAETGLTTRTNLYNSKKVDLVWSIHANAGTSSVNGRCAFYWHTSPEGKKAANLFVDEVNKSGYSIHGNGLHASEKGSWTNMHICRETNMPSVLTENGFMTNDDDFELIFGSKQDKYIHDMTRVHTKAICRYFGVAFKENIIITKTASYNTEEDGLTLSQYNDLKKEINELRDLIKGDKTDEPSKWAKPIWDKKVKEGYFDGTRPKDNITRQEVAVVIDRLVTNINEYHIEPLKEEINNK